MVWFEFLVTNTFLIWNVRWAIKSQNAQLKVATSWKCKMPPRFYSRICNFCVKERTVCISTLSVLLRTGLQPTSEQAQAVCEFVWAKDVASRFSQGWGQKWGSLLLLSLVTDASMVRKHCWLLEGKVTQPIEQQAQKSLIIAFLAIVIRLPDTPSWQEIHETFSAMCDACVVQVSCAKTLVCLF